MVRKAKMTLRTGSLAALAALLAHQDASGEGFRNPPPGGFSLGRAGGRIAQMDNAEAAMHNPANLVNIPTISFELAPTFVYLDVEHDNQAGFSAETTDPLKVLPHAFASIPIIENKLAAGLALTTPFGLGNEWKDEGAFGVGGPLRYTAPYFTEMVTVNANPSLSWRISDWVSVGAGLNVYWSQLTLKQFYPWAPFGSMTESRLRARGDDVALGGNVGVTFNLTERQRLAFTYRSPFTMHYEGDLHVRGAMPAAAAGLGATSKSDFKSEVEFPTIVSAGYGIELTDKIRIEADVEWLQFSNFDTLPLEFGNNSFLVPFTEIRQDWDDTFTAGIAGDWQFAEEWTWRAGYQFYESPVPNDTFSPTIPDANQHAFTTGLNFSRGHHSAEFAYGYIKYDDRNITSNQNPAFLGKYEMMVHLFSLAYTFDF